MSMNDINSLSHTKWNCKYHIVFAPKYRRKVFYGEKKAAIGKILRQLCEWKGVKIIEAEMCPDHVHMLVEIPPNRDSARLRAASNSIATGRPLYTFDVLRRTEGFARI